MGTGDWRRTRRRVDRGRRSSGGPAALWVFVLPLLALPGSGAAPIGPNAGSPLGLALEVSPQMGGAPLVVSFHAQVDPAAPTVFAWSFGDGTYWNSSSGGNSSGTHLYDAPGSFRLAVTATSAGLQVSSNVTVDVSAATLNLSVRGSPLSGDVPLTTNFTAVPAGGSGTYPSISWSFGDGGVGSGTTVAYTFRTVGTFRVEVTVRDSQNGTTSAFLTVNAYSPGSGPTPAATSNPWALAEGLGAVAIVVLGVAVGLGVRTVARSRPRPPGKTPVVPPFVPPAPVEPVLESPSPAVPPTSAQAGSPAPPTEAIATRLLVRLYGLGVLGPEDLATDDRTQAGLAKSLDLRQTAVSRVLRQLEAGGALQAETRHVRGRERRVRVYTLTPAGERVARGLRRAQR